MCMQVFKAEGRCMLQFHFHLSLEVYDEQNWVCARIRTSQETMNLAFVAQHPIRGCLPTHRQTLPREFVAQHPIRGFLPTHSHCRCQCGRA